jgi:hypothetical protein
MGDPTTRSIERAAEDRAISNPEDHVRREALQRTIAARLLVCNIDELRVLDVLLGRLELGRDRYGYLDLARSRDWEREEAEEHADAAVYRACKVLADREDER